MLHPEKEEIIRNYSDITRAWKLVKFKPNISPKERVKKYITDLEQKYRRNKKCRGFIRKWINNKNFLQRKKLIHLLQSNKKELVVNNFFYKSEEIIKIKKV